MPARRSSIDYPARTYVQPDCPFKRGLESVRGEGTFGLSELKLWVANVISTLCAPSKAGSAKGIFQYTCQAQAN